MKSEEEIQQQFDMESLIINDFIAKDMAFSTVFNEQDQSIKYNTLHNEDMKAQDQKSFHFYNERYLEHMNGEQAVKLSFENFILADNPRDDFQDDLTNLSLGTTNTPAYEYEKIYSGDIELHKKSALKGYKASLLEVGAGLTGAQPA